MTPEKEASSINLSLSVHVYIVVVEERKKQKNRGDSSLVAANIKAKWQKKVFCLIIKEMFCKTLPTSVAHLLSFAQLLFNKNISLEKR